MHRLPYSIGMGYRKAKSPFPAIFCLAAMFVLLRTGLWFKLFRPIGKWEVESALDATRQEAERQANQPRTVILKSGEKIECKRVLDEVQYWGLLRVDGRATAIKKEEVQGILGGDASNGP